MENAWFKDWFDSHYYHILYENRDESEARHFLDRLIDYLNPDQSDYMLDLACGKGRFATYLAAKKFHVIGVDLSEESILEARKSESENLFFYMHDMRDLFRTNYFDFIFNFFTSFGYFSSDRAHLKTLKNIRKGLKPNGIFVMDFLNVSKAIKKLPAKSKISKKGIIFITNKALIDGKIVKVIDVIDEEQRLRFKEEVRAFSFDELDKLFKQAGLRIKKTFGTYNLDPYIENESDRLILIAEKHA